MWHQPSPWHNATRLCSGESTENIVLDRRRSVRYAQKHENTGFFGNVTAVLAPSGLEGDHTGAFSG